MASVGRAIACGGPRGCGFGGGSGGGGSGSGRDRGVREEVRKINGAPEWVRLCRSAAPAASTSWRLPARDLFSSPRRLALTCMRIRVFAQEEDAKALECRGCSVKFSLIVRKHHCRHCGAIFCVQCCREKRPLPKFDCKRT